MRERFGSDSFLKPSLQLVDNPVEKRRLSTGSDHDFDIKAYSFDPVPYARVIARERNCTVSMSSPSGYS